MPANTKANTNTNNAAYQFLKRVTCGDSTYDTAHMVDLCFFCAYLGADVAKLSWGGMGEPADWEHAQRRFSGLFDAYETEDEARKAIKSKNLTPQKLADSAAEWLAQQDEQDEQKTQKLKKTLQITVETHLNPVAGDVVRVWRYRRHYYITHTIVDRVTYAGKPMTDLSVWRVVRSRNKTNLAWSSVDLELEQL